MIAASSNSPIDSLIEKNVKIRYLLKRSSRYGDEFMTSHKRQEKEEAHEKPIIKDQITNDGQINKQKLLQRLRKLGLAPRKYTEASSSSSSSSKRKCQPRKRVVAQVPGDEDFALPRVFECDYCPRIFFNHTLYRCHVIRHLRIRRCQHCNQPFKTRAAHRRHEINCKRKVL